ncbi:MAG: sugar transferase [Pseudomonadota bacterium]
MMAALVSRLCALVLLVVLSPVMLTLWLICAIVQGRPVLFRQYRSGKGTIPFRLLKFRSMRDIRDENGGLLPDDQRVTGIGTFLRRSRLDELPGLVNVLRGEMAFVGPRPLLPATIEELGSRGWKRCAVKPGLTGWSQVNGNTLLTLDRKINLDLWYIDNRSAFLDLRILALTVLVMIGGEKVRTGTA